MTDYYSILGLSKSASTDEIKKAYRSMAMKHHPDRGGDESKFKQINEAYEILSDPEKKQMVDMGVDPKAQQQGPGGFQQGPFEFHFGSGNFEDVFSQFGFGFGGRRSQKRNRSINITVEISLEDVLTGKEINAEISVPNGSTRTITINVPPGIDNGQQVRYRGLGDNSIPGVPPGDLLVDIRVKADRRFRREGQNIVVEKNISVWDAMLGTSLKIETLDKKNLEIVIPPGTQSGTVMSCRGEGLPVINYGARGNLLIKINVVIPKKLSESQKEKIRNIKNEF
jgi:curved DNA-binding protein